METKSKARARNFTEFEKSLLFDIVQSKFLSVIENKKTDAVTLTYKQKAWDKICTLYNTQAQTGSRTAKQLHALYDILKKNARSHSNSDKANTYKTGLDHTFITRTTPPEEKIIVTQFEPLINNFDSSANYYSTNEIDGHTDDNIFETNTSVVVTSPIDKYSMIILDDDETSVPESEPPVAQQNEDMQVTLCAASSTNPTCSRKRNRPGLVLPSVKKQKCHETLTDLLCKSKIFKDKVDAELAEKKQAILEVELQIKKKQLEAVQRQIEQQQALFEVDLAIKKAQLEKIQKGETL